MQAQVHLLTTKCPMDAAQFWSRIESSSLVEVIQNPGYVDVFKGDQHIARWIQGPSILWYAPKNGDNGAQTSQRTLEDVWPPACPDCGGPTVVKFGGRPRGPFWSCRKFDGPWPRVCEGRAAFSLHPEEMEEYRVYDPYNPHWSPRINKSARDGALRRKWQQLAERSLARLNGAEK